MPRAQTPERLLDDPVVAKLAEPSRPWSRGCRRAGRRNAERDDPVDLPASACPARSGTGPASRRSRARSAVVHEQRLDQVVGGRAGARGRGGGGPWYGGGGGCGGSVAGHGGKTRAPTGSPQPRRAPPRSAGHDVCAFAAGGRGHAVPLLLNHRETIPSAWHVTSSPGSPRRPRRRPLARGKLEQAAQ